MRLKNAFSNFHPSDKEYDIEKLRISNPLLWKKLKKQFDTGRKNVYIQLNNGLEKTNESTLRYYLMEFTNRFLQYGPESFPTSYNPLEPFFVYNIHNSIIQLLSDEESYGVSLIDFLDFVTDKNFDLEKIDFYENIPENLIYHFTFTTGFDEINFSNNGKTFVIGGLSLVRQENEVSILMQAGESYNEEEVIEYFKGKTRSSVQQFITPSKKSLGLHIEGDGEPELVPFKDRSDLWAHNISVLFDLNDRSIDIRHVARDENINFHVITDDFFAIFQSKRDLSKEDKKFFENHLKELSNYDAVFDFAKYCLALPYYVFENENRIISVTYETNLNSIIKGPISAREYASVPSGLKVFAKPLYYLESNDQIVIKENELNDNSFKIEKSGYWRRLNVNEEGFDKNGKKIMGKTWVERNDIYYSIPKGVTKVEKVEVFSDKNAGYIYIMREPTHEENIFKIGLTKRNSETRSKELSNTSSPDKFFIINSYHTKNCVEAEKQIHKELENYRITTRREFFRCDLKIIMNACEKIISNINK